MPQITIEYIILLPILITQVFLFPMTASWLMNICVDSRRTLALKDITSHLGSTIQQLFFSLNHESISVGTATYSTHLPPLIEDNYFTGNATLRSVTEPAGNSSKVLEITMTLKNTQTSASSQVILGPNALWKESTFVSNSTSACVKAEKFLNGTICLYFGA